MDKAYRNVSIFVVLILIGVQWGFYKNYTSQFPEFKGSTSIHHIHGALMMVWLVLLFVQPLLIMTGRNQLHRTIGKSSYVIGPLIIISLFLVGRAAYFNDIQRGAPMNINLAIRALDIRGLLSFALFWALAMINRKNSAVHMRYMIGTAILAIGPGVGRGLINSFGLSLWDGLAATDMIDIAIVSVLLGYDFYKKRNPTPYLIILAVLVVSAVIWQLRLSTPWQAFAGKWAALFY
jgi:hypothetical protein